MPPKKKRKTAPSDDHSAPSIQKYFKSTATTKVAEPNKDEPPITKKPKTTPTTGETLPSSQVQTIASKKYEAEAKLWAKKLGAESLGPTWMVVLGEEFKKKYFTKLMEFVQAERQTKPIFPPASEVFSWTNSCRINEVKVVILGQDPYHGQGQAHGLCFSVKVGIHPPPSLINMYKELSNDINGFVKPDHGYLEGWARQGVLLLNACLTVQEKKPNSHSGKGWEQLTDAVIEWLNSNFTGLVFILWGGYAQKKGSFIDKKKHHVLTAPHPSPLSASKGFFGCKHFSTTNNLLVKQGKPPIDWTHLPKTL